MNILRPKYVEGAGCVDNPNKVEERTSTFHPGNPRFSNEKTAFQNKSNPTTEYGKGSLRRIK